ncbi:hypothetical protein ACTHQ4_02415 [Alkalicoccobacillus gibsonii]|uniref:hypothetical protein n=1 Tax=Alkalicoccobacillus gibsonii TaxID=79881 RepID=UPI003F7CCCA5
MSYSPNDSINELTPEIDLVVDEYGNYYQVKEIRQEKDRLHYIMLDHFLNDWSFSIIPNTIEKEFSRKHIGYYFNEILEGHITKLKQSNRRLFSILELKQEGIIVEFIDLTISLRNK